MEPEGPEITPVVKQTSPNLPWPFWALLTVGPAVLALVGCVAKADTLIVYGSLVGSAVSGLVGGAVMGMRLGKYPGSKIAFGILFTVLIASLSLGLSFCGCVLGRWRGPFF
jgi:hypothetical protein